MKHTQIRYGIALGVTGAMCLGLTGTPSATAAPGLQTADYNWGKAQAIPFDPPVVHPGWAQGDTVPQQQAKPSHQIGTMRDLMFRDSDRHLFQAMHPFLLHPPKTVKVQKSPRKPIAPQAKKGQGQK
ncbi:MAG: hypothetical protein JO316_19005 [Abitibacteriaceae bacterium]|nr:hypothetical protein [Abditibacteriaceae bacterium]